MLHLLHRRRLDKSARPFGADLAARDTLTFLAYREKPDVFDDGPAKPVRIWSRIGRRPLIAVGNSNGDIPMLQFAQQSNRLYLSMLLLHDDKSRDRTSPFRAAMASACFAWFMMLRNVGKIYDPPT